jgi:cytochrome P450
LRVFSNEHPYATDVDISSREFWSRPFAVRDEAFARLRAEAPVSWHRPVDYVEPHDQQGFWAVTRAADITAVSRNSELFQSRYGVLLDPVPPDMATIGTFFLTMDPPEHSRYRSLISSAFTPRQVRRISDRIHATAVSIVDDLVGAGDIDFVRDCSSRLPMATVSDIVGVPESERARVAQAAEHLVGGGKVAAMEPQEAVAFLFEEVLFLHALGASLAAHRRREPADDLMTGLVQAEIDGARLTDENIGAFLLLMSVAGNDTTKQTTTHAMLELGRHPDQRDWLMADFDGRITGAIEEFVRCASPVIQFTRTAARDTELGGARIAAGDKVALFYASGNRDESVFEDPHVFDLSRPRSPHVAFGGGGAHYCLGAGVAKVQLRSIIGELLRRVPRLELGEPVLLQSNFINGITSLPAHVG